MHAPLPERHNQERSKAIHDVFLRLALLKKKYIRIEMSVSPCKALEEKTVILHVATIIQVKS